eukprot:6926623-Heterocapsa_arctica.AAC.1
MFDMFIWFVFLPVLATTAGASPQNDRRTMKHIGMIQRPGYALGLIISGRGNENTNRKQRPPEAATRTPKPRTEHNPDAGQLVVIASPCGVPCGLPAHDGHGHGHHVPSLCLTVRART